MTIERLHARALFWAFSPVYEDMTMKATNANQREMRHFSARHDTGFSQSARDLRAENARRTLAAQPAREWLMRDVSSTPYATVIS